MSVVSASSPRVKRKRGYLGVREDSTRLGTYTNPRGRRREIVRSRGAGGGTLVIDRDALTRLDERLVAQLPCDEPDENSRVVCALYLADAQGRHCRRVTQEDRTGPPPSEDSAGPPTHDVFSAGSAPAGSLEPCPLALG
jgi:hypothetical protein